LPPLFLAAPIYGSVFPYHQLVLHLDPEQPVYGLQSPAFDGVTPAHQTLQEQARDYIAAMKRVQRTGPYHVGGYSFGGWTAFEMARQLLAAGERVAFLGILGTTPPPSLAAPMQAKVMEHVWDLSDAQARLARDTGTPEEQRVAAQRVPGAAVGTPLQRIALANTLAALRYVPGPIESELSIFVTMDFLSRSPVDRTMGWWLLSTREIDVQIHDGTHQTCLTDPHVRDLANKVSARLKVVRAR
jgi:thioesterase domain-containing protein